MERAADSSPEKHRRAPRLAARLVATFGAGVVGLFLVELALRAFDLGPPPAFEREGGLFRPSEIEGARFENSPGAVERLLYRDRANSAPRVVEMRVNAQGFRGAEIALEKPSDARRIACVGDSHTFGFGVRADETWPDHLARELARRFADARFEVMNCGVNNYDTVQEVAWLRARVLPFQPDLVLLQFYVNDAAVHGVERAQPAEPDLFLRWTDPSRDNWFSSLRRASRFADLVCDGIYRRRGLAVYSAERTRLFDEAEPGWRLVRAALCEARDALRASDIPFVVVLYPFLVREGRYLTSHRAFEIVQQFCASEGIHCIDAEPAFLAADLDALRVSPHDYHGNANAHRIFAAAVATALEQRGLLDAAVSR